MLRHRVNADDYMWTPFFKYVPAESDTPTLKELASLRTKPVHCPVEILHPTLLVTKYPVIDADELVCNVMRFFDCLDDSDGNRLSLPDSLQPLRQSLRSRPMTATGIG
jgi:hypothetical protein